MRKLEWNSWKLKSFFNTVEVKDTWNPMNFTIVSVIGSLSMFCIIFVINLKLSSYIHILYFSLFATRTNGMILK